MVKCKQREKQLFLNLKVSEKNNKEIQKSQLLLKNKEKIEKSQTKLKDNRSPKKLNFMKLNTLLLKSQKLNQEEMFSIYEEPIGYIYM